MLNNASHTEIRRDGEAGTSLVELVIIFMMIAIILAFSLPAIGNTIRSYNLRNTAERIAERLSGARALAMAKNKNVTISFRTNTVNYGYDFSPSGAPDGIPDSSDPDNTTQSYYVESLPSGMTWSFSAGGTALANGTGVTYTSRGELPIGASQADLILTSSSKTMTVSVNLRGQVWVH
jgi:Tfp pilus assembly protein FimT